MLLYHPLISVFGTSFQLYVISLSFSVTVLVHSPCAFFPVVPSGAPARGFSVGVGMAVGVSVGVAGASVAAGAGAVGVTKVDVARAVVGIETELLQACAKKKLG